MFSFDLNKLKLNSLIYILSFFIGVYCLCYISSINYISFPIDHFCSPPFDFATEQWSPRDWKRYAIPYWDQIPDSLNSPEKENTQSKCLQFTVVENTTDSVMKIEIKYSTDYIIPCQYGWYFSHREISIISQLELVCDKGWIITLCPLVFVFGFLLSLIILKFEHQMLILYITITLMLGTNLSICLVHNFKIFIALNFMTAFFFGANFLLAILLINKLGIEKRYDFVLLSAVFGWIFARGLIPQIIWLFKDWKIVHILMSFSVMPVIFFGVILFKMQANEPLNNVKYIEETELNHEEHKAIHKEVKKSENLRFLLVLISSLVYFTEDFSLHKKVEIFSKTTYNSFMMVSLLQFVAISFIFIAKRKFCIYFLLLISLSITCVCNLWFSYLGLFGNHFSEITLNVFDTINKIGVSATFYMNLIILMDQIKVKTTRFNLFLLIVMTVSYGISAFITEFENSDIALKNICFASAILIVIVWLLIERLQLYQYFFEKKQINEKVIYSKQDFNEDKLCIISDS